MYVALSFTTSVILQVRRLVSLSVVLLTTTNTCLGRTKSKRHKKGLCIVQSPFLFCTTEVDYLFFFDVMPPFFVNVMVDCCSLRDVWSKIRLGLNRRPLK